MLKLYNTLTRKKEVFSPIKKRHVSMYTCGPTVYNHPHIGNYRAYIVADLLKRYLKYKGFKIKHIMNITDVDDKTIRDSQKQQISLKEFTRKYEKAFMEDLKKLNIDFPDKFPRATEHIKEMVKIIENLLDKGIAYKGDDNSIYYSVSKFKDYGKLAHIKFKELKAGARVKQDEYEKEQANDFALWKAYDKEDGDVFWETGIGKGRPGWHIECSAMSSKYLGDQFDIHTGGIDLVFPHHENEIAQSEGATGKKPFVKYWIHNDWLLVEGKKMSKSLGNFYILNDLLDKGYDPMPIKYALLSTHYRQQLNFTFKDLEASKNAIQRLNTFLWKIQTFKQVFSKKHSDSEIAVLIEKAKKEFMKKMDDDLNISEALAIIFDFISEINKKMAPEGIDKKDAKTIYDFMLDIDSVLGVLNHKRIPEKIIKLKEERDKARKNKDYKKSDEIREKAKKEGFTFEDTPSGTAIIATTLD